MLRELDGLRSLARALVAGDADADDLLQDTALAALEHPPDTDRPGAAVARRRAAQPAAHGSSRRGPPATA